MSELYFPEILKTDTACATIAATTLTTGVATMLELIPGEIGKLASLCGVMLTSLLIYHSIKKIIIDKKHVASQMKTDELEREKLRAEIMLLKAKQAGISD